jgi:hypothetical protein
MIGPYFFDDEGGSAVSVTSQRYVNMLEIFLAPSLHSLPNLDIQHTWFQQEGAISHTARQSMASVKRLFGDRIISRNANIAWSPDLKTSQSVTTFYGDIWRALCTRLHQQTLPSSRLRLKKTSPAFRRTHCAALCKIFRIDLLNVYSEMDST